MHNAQYAMPGASLYQNGMFQSQMSMGNLSMASSASGIMGRGTPSGGEWRASTTSLPGGMPNASPAGQGTPALGGGEKGSLLGQGMDGNGNVDAVTQVERVLQSAFDKVEQEIKDNGVEKALEKISSLATSFAATYKNLVKGNTDLGKSVVARLIRKIASMRMKAKRIVFFKFLMSLTIAGEKL